MNAGSDALDEPTAPEVVAPTVCGLVCGQPDVQVRSRTSIVGTTDKTQIEELLKSATKEDILRMQKLLNTTFADGCEALVADSTRDGTMVEPLHALASASRISMPSVHSMDLTREDVSIDATIVQTADIPQDHWAQGGNSDEHLGVSMSVPGTPAEVGVSTLVDASSEQDVLPVESQGAQEPAAVASVPPSVHVIEGDDMSIVKASGIPQDHRAQGGNSDESSGWFSGWFAG
jgi:hypothetical protein